MNLENRARRAAPSAIGLPYKIRTAPKRYVSGTIIEAEFARIRTEGTTRTAIFRIVMECGANKVRREFHCATLPR